MKPYYVYVEPRINGVDMGVGLDLEPATPAQPPLVQSPLQIFLGQVAEPISTGLLRGPPFKPLRTRTKKKTTAEESVDLRRSRRIANQPPELQGTAMTKAKRMVCRQLGVEFEEPITDPADLLDQYGKLFQGPLTEIQIQAFTLLIAQIGGKRGFAAV